MLSTFPAILNEYKLIKVIKINRKYKKWGEVDILRKFFFYLGIICPV